MEDDKRNEEILDQIDKIVCHEKVITMPAFRVTIVEGTPTHQVVGTMLGAFYQYLASLGTVYVRKPPEIQRDFDYELDKQLIIGSFRVGLDTSVPPIERRVIRTDTLNPTIGNFDRVKHDG